ncbi:NADH dehydrogenase [ubiquinone] 1 beta subcomplex subunit 3-like [Babylonia areolata]|uniref:NADH dehydrogenase [ubiquinone] 1 beta subcomplex subunit 3-like n=1 Tax=Babylonia areolata TaxID=304850 RepID=UPI003FD64148
MADPNKFKVPDWRSYKVDGIPELEKTQRLLAARHLRDPWLRNEVWRYTKANYGGQYKNALINLGKGLKWALVAMVLTLSLEELGSIFREQGTRLRRPLDDESND